MKRTFKLHGRCENGRARVELTQDGGSPRTVFDSEFDNVVMKKLKEVATSPTASGDQQDIALRLLQRWEPVKEFMEVLGCKLDLFLEWEYPDDYPLPFDDDDPKSGVAQALEFGALREQAHELVGAVKENRPSS